MSPSISSTTSSIPTRKNKLPNKSSKEKMAPGRGFQLLHTGIASKEYVWCDATETGNQEAVWTRAQALAQSGPLLTVRTENSHSVLQLDLRDTLVLPANSPGAVSAQITSLRHINEPCILDNLEQRAEAGEPYTFLGGVLVYVNPLVWGTEDPALLGSSDIVGNPHPYAVAEAAFQHMSYHADKHLSLNAITAQQQQKARAQGRRGNQTAQKSSQRLLSQDEQANQSIVTSGESGSGKTECTKMLLRQLMARSGSGKGEGKEESLQLEKLVMESNVLTEAFGNATTLRNANSSRFGKLLKLFFRKTSQKTSTNRKGSKRPSTSPAQARWHVSCASTETYLLEKTRVVHTPDGESSFRIFHELYDGADKKKRHELGLDAAPIRPIDAVKESKATHKQVSGTRFATLPVLPSALNDKEHREARAKDYHALISALETMGVDDSTTAHMFQVVAGVLHLGNIEFGERAETAGAVAFVKSKSSNDRGSGNNYNALGWAASLLGVESEKLERVVLDHVIVVRGESTTVPRSARAAKFAVDAIAKGIYALLFEWVVARINVRLGFLNASKGSTTSAELERLPTIGILDIFGFECFKRNGFEQLLIAAASDALNEAFTHAVLELEHDLFKKEGLTLGASSVSPKKKSSKKGSSSGNTALELLLGVSGGSASANMSDVGLLMMIDAQCQIPQPTDLKLNSALHRTFAHNQFFIAPHPKDKADTFIVRHFAGAVSYNVEGFIETNNDRMPNGVDAVFLSSTNDVVVAVFDNPAEGGDHTKVQGTRHSHQLRLQANNNNNRPTHLTTTRRIKSTSIVVKFRMQIQGLLEELDRTHVSFVRCVKPNPEMSRRAGWWGRAGVGWFNRRYITEQLRVLCIPQTAGVLQEGLPTRMPYSDFLSTYKTVLPKDAIHIWESRGKADKKNFVRALFFAFHIPTDAYRMGHSLVFFENNMLGKVDRMLLAPSEDKQKKKISNRFKLYYIRIQWRTAFVKVLALNRFLRMYGRIHTSRVAALKVQSFLRMAEAKTRVNALRAEREREKKRALRAAERKKKRKLAAKKAKEELARAKAEAAAQRKRDKAKQDAAAEAKLHAQVVEMERMAEELKALHQAEVKEELAKERAAHEKREKERQEQKQKEMKARQAKESRAQALEAVKRAKQAKKERAAQAALRADLEAHEAALAEKERRSSKNEQRHESQTSNNSSINRPHPAADAHIPTEDDDEEAWQVAWRSRRKVLAKKMNAHMGGALASQLELTRAGQAGRTAVTQKHNVTQAEMQRPVLSADQHLHKLEELTRNGRITRTESDALYSRVLDSLNTTTRKPKRSRNVSVAAAAYRHRKNTHGNGETAKDRVQRPKDDRHMAETPTPAPPRTQPFRRHTKNQIHEHTENNNASNTDQDKETTSQDNSRPHMQRSQSRASGIQFFCEHCGGNCNTYASGSQCPECGHVTDLPDPGTSSEEEDDEPTNSPLIQSVFSHHDDWIGKVPFRDGQVLVRMGGSETAIDPSSFTEVRVFVVQLRWMNSGEPLEWKVRHAFTGYERLASELAKGYTNKLFPVKLRRELPNFPGHLSGHSVNRNVREREAALAGWLADTFAVIQKCEQNGKRFSIEAIMQSKTVDAFFEMPFYSGVGRARRPVSRILAEGVDLQPIDVLHKKSKKSFFSWKTQWHKRYMRLDDHNGRLIYAKGRTLLDDKNKYKTIAYSDITRVALGRQLHSAPGEESTFIEHSFDVIEEELSVSGIGDHRSIKRLVSRERSGRGKHTSMIGKHASMISKHSSMISKHTSMAQKRSRESSSQESSASSDEMKLNEAGHSELAKDLEITLKSGKKLVFRAPEHIQADTWVEALMERVLLKVRIFTVDEAQQFPEAYSRPSLPSTAVCFSGGGVRSHVATVGQLRGLMGLGLMDDDHIGYMSTVSGSSWALGGFFYYRKGASKDADLLGRGFPHAQDMKHVSLAMLRQHVAPLLRPAQTQLQALAMKHVLSTESHDLWGRVIGEAFLEPFGLEGDLPFTTSDLLPDLLRMNPRLKTQDFLVAKPKRPFLIINGVIIGPEVSRVQPRDLVPLHMTPMYVGFPALHEITYDRKARWMASRASIKFKKIWVGGGLVESFAFGSRAPITYEQVPFTLSGPDGEVPTISTYNSFGYDEEDILTTAHSHSSRISPAPHAEVPIPEMYQARVPAPDKLFSLEHALAISSHMVGMKYQQSSLKIRFNQHDLYWSPSPDLQGEVEETMFDIADGYLLDDTGILAALQRRVRRIVVFVNGTHATAKKFDTESPSSWVSAEIPSLFGYTKDNGNGNYKRNNQVFAKHDLGRLRDAIQTKINAKGPVVVAQRYMVKENKWLGIEGGHHVRVMWFFIHPCSEFNKLLDAEVVDEINKGRAGEFHHFPGFKTFGQNTKGDVNFSPAQSNLLAMYTEWMVRGQKDILTKWLQRDK